ncbi:MAG: hypothetical protein AB7K71_13035 [Polyangiaceae bacterium]
MKRDQGLASGARKHSRVPWWLMLQRTIALLCMLLGVTCGGSDPADSGKTNSSALRVWAPSRTGVALLFELDLRARFEQAGIQTALQLEPLEFGQIEDFVRAGIADGSLDADALMLPWGIAQRLLADGLILPPEVEMFSSTDPNEASELLGIVVARPAMFSQKRTDLDSTPQFDHGCLVPGSASERPVVTAQSSAKLEDWTLIDGVFEAGEKAVIDQATDTAIDKTVKDPLKKKGVALLVKKLVQQLEGDVVDHAIAQTVALRALSKALKIVDAGIDYYHFLQLLYKSVDTNDATLDAYESAVDTFAEASQQIVDARQEVFLIEGGVLDCSYSGPDAIMRLDELADLVKTYENVARGALSEMATIKGDVAPNVEESLDNAVERFVQKWAEVRKAAQAKADSVTPINETASQLVADDPNTPDPEWKAFVELFTGLDPDNPFTHSNGVLMTTSDGPTDLIGFGAAWLDVSAQAATFLFSDSGQFPCGNTPSAIVLCGSEPFPAGPALIGGMLLDSAVPSSGTQDYQLALVADGDGVSSNNYMASASYPGDLFDNTDQWFEFLFDHKTMTWTLKVTTARDGSFTQPASAARAILNQDALLFVIPASEFEAAAPEFRVTAFRHNGDFGLNPPNDFNGDVFPLVGDPLASPSTVTFMANDGT